MRAAAARPAARAARRAVAPKRSAQREKLAAAIERRRSIEQHLKRLEIALDRARENSRAARRVVDEAEERLGEVRATEYATRAESFIAGKPDSSPTREAEAELERVRKKYEDAKSLCRAVEKELAEWRAELDRDDFCVRRDRRRRESRGAGGRAAPRSERASAKIDSDEAQAQTAPPATIAPSRYRNARAKFSPRQFFFAGDVRLNRASKLERRLALEAIGGRFIGAHD